MKISYFNINNIHTHRSMTGLSKRLQIIMLANKNCNTDNNYEMKLYLIVLKDTESRTIGLVIRRNFETMRIEDGIIDQNSIVRRVSDP